MVTAHTWHPGTGRVVSRWPVPVALAPDELFSMWLVRAALAQGVDPLVLAGHLWPKWRVWTIDLDRGINDERMNTLARESGIDAATLRAASLLPIAVVTGLEPEAASGIWHWILALGSRNRKRRGGLQYCSLCLANDVRPYFRLHWRLAWHTCCAVHKVSLRDRCCHCQLPIEPNRLTAAAVMTSCANCKGDIRHCLALSAADAALAFQKCADQVALTGAGSYGAHRVQAKEWFHLARYFLMLLRCAVRHQDSGLGRCLAVVDPSVSRLRPPVTGLGFEMLPTLERSGFLESVGALIGAGPEQLRSAVIAESMNDTSLRQRWRSLPPHIDSLVHEIPQLVRSRKTKGNSTPAPMSRQTVLYKWARLQRKMRRAS
ncbi:TniQ family protein [Janthinobacterium sp. LB3P118]|uniref:TniQ family protein n=1 Tax=Janthinobacterium sp. LB3P118 TaxID=3424195 RepID=UPI003F23A882